MVPSVHPAVEIIGVSGLPLIHPGDDLPALISSRISLEDNDIVTVATTVYSKAKGFVRELTSITPSEEAVRISKLTREDPRFVQAILDEATGVLIETPFLLTSLPSGHVGVRSGVDQSNIEDGMIITLPRDPMGAAEEFQEALRRCTGKTVGVILTDTCGRAFRRGQTGHAIGWSGMKAIRDFRGEKDLFGHVLQITEEAVVDEIAGFANFMMGESDNGVPVVVFRGLVPWKGHDTIYFDSREDLFKKALTHRV